MKRLPHILNVLLLPALLLGLPLLGVWLAGKPVADYFEFPPLTRYVPHAGFSWPVFIAMAAGIGAFLVWLVAAAAKKTEDVEDAEDVEDRAAANPKPSSTSSTSSTSSKSSVLCPAQPNMPTSGQRSRVYCFPPWGWVAIGLVAVAWILAWTRFGWFAPCQKYTFIPLWLGYIVTVNALTFRRAGRCMLTHDTARFLRLFPASALFWWFFEYLNRFVQNWYYVGAEGMGPWQYTVVATLSFSTVLPAVLGTAELLGTWRFFGCEMFVGRVRPVGRVGLVRFLIITLSAAGLLGVGVWPDYLFPLLWLAPLGLLACGPWPVARGMETEVFLSLNMRHRPQATDHGPQATGLVARLMLAGLICGFFWEMWNIWSLAKWIYCVPFVDRFHLFEMPLLGYAGYLPFGIECAVAAIWMENVIHRLHRFHRNQA